MSENPYVRLAGPPICVWIAKKLGVRAVAVVTSGAITEPTLIARPVGR